MLLSFEAMKWFFKSQINFDNKNIKLVHGGTVLVTKLSFDLTYFPWKPDIDKSGEYGFYQVQQNTVISKK